MNMRADLLTCLRCSKYPDHGHFWLFVHLRRLDIAPELRIKARRNTLIMVDTIEPYAEEIHVSRWAGGRKSPSNAVDIVRSREKQL
jgi:hypothetical protein